jgi:hypothetical protein
MSKAPAFQFYAGDRAMDIMGLDNEAVGAWTRAMMFLWTNGPTPSERLQQVAGKGWERVAFLFSSFEGGLGLVWQEELREKQQAFRDRASSFGAKGGRPSKEKKGTLLKEKGLQKGTQRVRSMKNEVEVEEKKKERAHEPDLIPAGVTIPMWQAIKKWEQYRKERKSKLTPTGLEAFVKKCLSIGEDRAVAAIEHSIAQGWTGMYEPKGEQAQMNFKSQKNHADIAEGVEQILRAKYGPNANAGQ